METMRAAELTLREKASAFRAEMKAASDIEAAQEKSMNEAQSKASLETKMREIFGATDVYVIVIPAYADDNGETITVAQWQDLVFSIQKNHSYSGYYLNDTLVLCLDNCPRCGLRRLVPIGGESDLYWALSPDFVPSHKCPDEPEDWLINQDVRAAEIAANRVRLEQREEARRSVAFQQMVAEISGTPLEDAVVQIIAGIRALTQYDGEKGTN